MELELEFAEEDIWFMVDIEQRLQRRLFVLFQLEGPLKTQGWPQSSKQCDRYRSSNAGPTPHLSLVWRRHSTSQPANARPMSLSLNQTTYYF